MTRIVLFLLSILLLLLHSAEGRSVQRFSSIGDLPLESGAVLSECIVGYRTFGTLNADRSNAILYCTWYMGKSADLEGAIIEGQYPDTLQYFVIAVDALCDGVSSSPSNSLRQPGNSFPAVTIHDMVESQYRMVRKEFSITKLFGIVGGSMGGMQVFEWLVSYPDYIGKAVATVGSPRLTIYNKQTLSVLKTMIDYGKKYSITPSDLSTLYSMTFSLVLRSPEYIERKHSGEDLTSYLQRFRKDTISVERFTDLRYQLEAMIGHDIYRRFRGDIAAAAASVKAKVLLIAATNDLTVHPDPAVQFARAAHSQIILLTNDCGHLAPGCEQKRTAESIRSFFAQ